MNNNIQTTASPAAMQEQQQKPNATSAPARHENAAQTDQAAPTGGGSGAAPCSDSSGASDKQPIGWKIDFLDGEGNEIEMESFTYAFNPSDGTHRLEMILEESLRSFDIKAFARITPRGFSGVLKGKSMVILSSGEKLERDIYDLSSLPKCNSLT